LLNNSASARPKPPRHLRLATRKWFANVVETYALEPHHLKLLTLACEALDRAEQAREALAKHGTTYTDRWGCPRNRPEIAIERDSRLAYARLLRELDLDTDTVAEPRRPPALHSNR